MRAGQAESPSNHCLRLNHAPVSAAIKLFSTMWYCRHIPKTPKASRIAGLQYYPCSFVAPAWHELALLLGSRTVSDPSTKTLSPVCYHATHVFSHCELRWPIPRNPSSQEPRDEEERTNLSAWSIRVQHGAQREQTRSIILPT